MDDEVEFDLSGDTVKATKGEVTIELPGEALTEPLNSKELDERWRDDATYLMYWLVEHGGYLYQEEHRE